MTFHFLDGKIRTYFLMRCANFQSLIPILTILLHLCCRWPQPRFAHYPTFMRSAQSCDFYAENVAVLANTDTNLIRFARVI
jgi:hypothetical protein